MKNGYIMLLTIYTSSEILEFLRSLKTSGDWQSSFTRSILFEIHMIKI